MSIDNRSLIATMAAEGAKARTWRENMGMSREILAERTGYSATSIFDFEAGVYRSTKEAVHPKAMLTYKLACATIASGLSFDWGRVTINLE